MDISNKPNSCNATDSFSYTGVGFQFTAGLAIRKERE